MRDAKVNGWLHVAVDRQGRVLAQRVERGEEDAGAEIAVLHEQYLV